MPVNQENHDLFAHDASRSDLLILVDENDREQGTATKQEAHTQGLLHRAFSVVLLRSTNDDVELLLTQRAFEKYHSGGLWTNSCCSHPRSGENLGQAVIRRVQEELGASIEAPFEIGSFVYRADFENGLVEHEYDHVSIAWFEGVCAPDPTEVASIRWITCADLKRELESFPERFTAWAPRVLALAMDWIETHAEGTEA